MRLLPLALLLLVPATACRRPAWPLPQSPVAGVDLQGAVEYRPGTLPLVLCSPHDGTLQPEGLPRRSAGSFSRDVEATPLTLALAAALERRTGQRPHVVLCHLSRVGVDMNREPEAATDGHPAARRAWEAYHAATEAAVGVLRQRYGKGLVLDLHGHSHPQGLVEVGYNVDATVLDLPDGELDQPGMPALSSIRTLAEGSKRPFSALLRGLESLGGLLEARGFAAVPSPAHPGPGKDPYFRGGYHTRRHGSLEGGPIDAIQAEVPIAIRRDPARREAFAEALAEALLRFLEQHHGLRW